MKEFNLMVKGEGGAEVPIQILIGNGVLWVNGPENCLLRVCGLPKDCVVAGSEKDLFIDVSCGGMR